LVCYYFKETHGSGATESVIRELMGSPVNLSFVKIQEQSFKSIDGRINGEYLATPGGDAGEFILAL
jgi:hypothetical protein